MARPRQYTEPASEDVNVRVTPSQRRDLEQVARDNRSSMATIIREAIDEYVADYRERPVFRRTKPAS